MQTSLGGRSGIPRQKVSFLIFSTAFPQYTGLRDIDSRERDWLSAYNFQLVLDAQLSMA